jgi:hypothetical protein
MSPMVGPKTKRGRIVAAVAVVLVAAFCAFTLLLFVFPDLNAPERSDAIVVLGGNGAPPFDEGVTLAREGYAPTLVLSLIPQYSCQPSVVDLPKVRILCFRANPQSTRGEARSIAKLAAQYHWHRIIVVMPTTQATRARLRIGRCYSGQVLEVGVAPAGFGAWVRGFVYEWGALLKALVLQPSC